MAPSRCQRHTVRSLRWLYIRALREGEAWLFRSILRIFMW